MAFITDEMACGMAERVRQRAEADPLFAEECESLSESMRFLIRYDGKTTAITCECCGTCVVNVLEQAVNGDQRGRAIWEAETGRKHTLRRCNWKRDQAFSSKSSIQ